jgi:hypothetical protein
MTVLIVRLRGDLPDEEIAATGDDTGVLARVIGALDRRQYPYLTYVDQFGLTIFNRPQMEAIIPELTKLRKEKSTESIRAVIDRILEFAIRCRDGVHLYLEFEGD